jgi:HEAT repeat protein
VSALRDLVRYAESARSDVLDALGRALRDPAGEVRAAAATAVADVDGHEIFTALLEAADDLDSGVRQMAVSALGELGDPRALPRIEAALKDERAEVRFQAVIAFPRLAGEGDAGVLALEAATRDADPLVAHIALRMSEEIGEKAGEVDVRLLRRARALMGHETALVRVAAAILLARGGERAGRDVLAALVCNEVGTREGEDEAAAIELCGELRVEAALPGLERRAFGGALGFRRDRFAWHARVALARMGHERAVREIVKGLESWDRDKRTLAVAAVGRARIRAARGAVVALREGGRADPHAIDEALRALDEDEGDEGDVATAEADKESRA